MPRSCLPLVSCSLASFSLVLSISGCASAPRGSAAPRAQPGQAPAPHQSQPVPALLNSRPLPQSQLLPALFELAGAQALEEASLDVLLEQQLAQAGLALASDWQAREEELLLASIASEANTTPDEAARLLAQVRARRGLGPVRYVAQLRRTASLRTLVAVEAAPTPEQVQQELSILTSDRARIRLLVAPSQQAVQAARDETLLEQSPAARAARLSTLAQRLSTDPSASAGGLVDGLSLADPAVPSGLRAALSQLAQGEVSPVLALDTGFAIALLESRTPSPNATSEQAQARATLRLQRIAMDRLAQRLLAGASIAPLDASLLWSWQQPAP